MRTARPVLHSSAFCQRLELRHLVKRPSSAGLFLLQQPNKDEEEDVQCGEQSFTARIVWFMTR